jgi:hypothetical protein
MAPLFNAASSAWNNAFFFMGLVLSRPTVLTPAPSKARCRRTHNPKHPPN